VVCLPRTEELAKLVEKKLALLTRQERDGPETARSRRAGAAAGRAGQLEEAAALLDRVDPPVDELETTNPLQPSPLGVAEAMLYWARREVAARARDLKLLGRIYLNLGDATRVPALARSYRLRAARALGHAGVESPAIEAALSTQRGREPRRSA